MKDLPTGLSSLLTAVLCLALAAVVLIALVVIASKLNGRRLLRRAQEQIVLDEDGAHALQAELLEFIQFNSENQKEPVNIAGFWKGHKVSRPIRTALIGELVKKRIIGVVPRSYENEFFSFIAESWIAFFCLPPKTLVLSDRDWILMVSSRMNGREILIERMIVKIDSHDTSHKTKNVIRTDGGAVSGVAQGGHDPKVTVRDIEQGSVATDVDSLRRLVHALRLDASLANDAGIRSRLDTQADLLELDLEDPDSPETRQSVLDRISGLITKYGDAMETTIRILGSVAQN